MMIFYDSTFVYELESKGREYILRVVGLRAKDIAWTFLGKEWRGNEIQFDDMAHLALLKDGKEVYTTYNILSL